MYPDEFDYHEAGSVDEALELLGDHAGEEVELLAGGHSLLPAMKTGLSSPDVLIDVGGIDRLHGVSVEDDALVVGAMTRYSDFLDAEAAHEHAPAFAAAVGAVGDEQVRNRGTVGGNLAHADPASDLPGAALASDATVVVEGPDGERSVPAEEFFFGMYATALGPDEILTRVEIPSATDAVGTYAKRASTSSGYAVVGVAVLLETDGETVASARIGANGVMDHGVRLDAAEEALVDESLDEAAIEAAGEAAPETLDSAMVMDDLQASAEFREQTLRVYTKRALRDLREADATVAAD
ncbi:FAD binding domain-containing protein [Halorubrum aethiopicum]|uniref:FAD binding domain-containing protein n=1 Tax=Halorubrum aethiopicum TaxID=1758255 RepID=UPI00082E7985|nr:xanthine dehydrogenase family protein subunit M [Halorubrum aethiopicum]